jgi:hypothetical protein
MMSSLAMFGQAFQFKCQVCSQPLTDPNLAHRPSRKRALHRQCHAVASGIGSAVAGSIDNPNRLRWFAKFNRSSECDLQPTVSASPRQAGIERLSPHAAKGHQQTALQVYRVTAHATSAMLAAD